MYTHVIFTRKEILAPAFIGEIFILQFFCLALMRKIIPGLGKNLSGEKF
jgi:hypothetical protein